MISILTTDGRELMLSTTAGNAVANFTVFYRTRPTNLPAANIALTAADLRALAQAAAAVASHLETSPANPPARSSHA
jgi:hypothetical protein